MPRSPHGFVALACVVVLSLSGPAPASPVIFSASGADAASIQSTVDAFRTALGGINNGNLPGSQGSGRREINWDGGTATTNTVTNAPLLNTFNSGGTTRGGVFTTPGTGFIQGPPTGVGGPPNVGLVDQFNNATYSAFRVFSPNRLFSAIGSNVTDAFFFIPGTNTPAATPGFGVVFSDVDLLNSTSIQFFDVLGTPLTLPIFAQPQPLNVNNGLSFLGVVFNAGEQIGFARITSGNAVPGPNANDGGGTDVVFMDDFIFGEPRAITAIPEPAALSVLAGLVVAAFARRRRGPGV